MSRMLELSDETYSRLLDAAAASGLTPVEWIAAHLPDSAEEEAVPEPTQTLAEQNPEPRTLADFLEGHIGVINCSGGEDLAANHSKLYGDYLEQRRRDGRL